MEPTEIAYELKRQKIQKAIDAGFTESQANYLVEEVMYASLGIGGFF